MKNVKNGVLACILTILKKKNKTYEDLSAFWAEKFALEQL
jgi:hypothetical protein